MSKFKVGDEVQVNTTLSPERIEGDLKTKKEWKKLGYIPNWGERSTKLNKNGSKMYYFSQMIDRDLVGYRY